MRGRVRFIGGLLLLQSTLCMAEVYRYRDKEGREHYVTSPESVPEQYRDTLKTPHALPSLGRYKSSGSPAAPVARAKVVVFVTEWCPYCKQLEAFLKSRAIPYKAYDIERNAEGRRLYSSLGVSGVPVVKIGGTVIPGYDPDRILATLGR